MYGTKATTIGCKDKFAVNYDPTANLQCTDCCKYVDDYSSETSFDYVGCTDKYAINYNPNAIRSCNGCCTYSTVKSLVPILGEIPEPSYDDTFPYDINPVEVICISETAYEETGWITEEGTYGTGYEVYKDDLLDNLPSGNIPNGNMGWSSIWTVFDNLLINRPNSRVFINKTDLVPWIVPIYIENNPYSSNPNQNRFKTDCHNIGGTLYINKDSELGDTMVCLCEITPEPTTQCLSLFYDINRPEVSRYEPLTYRYTTCLKTYEEFISFINQQVTLGWRGEQTTFFNTFFLETLGISSDDAKFVVNNFFNTGTGFYPYNTQNVVPVAKTVAQDILRNAFDNGANFFIPFFLENSTDIVHKKECCDSINGLFKGGTYDLNGKPVNTGVCLCNEIITPCPNLTSGEVEILTETFETTKGLQQTTYVNVEERCCSNESLQSKMFGNWEWDGKRCVLNTTVDNSLKSSSTFITINETPLNIKDVTCVDNVITVSAYVYFETPNNKCVNGTLVSDTSDRLTDQFLELVKNPPETAEEISVFSTETWTTETSYSNDGKEPTTQTQSTNCCYDTSLPINGFLVIQDQNFNKIENVSVDYVDTFSTTETILNTNENIGQGFNKWVKLTTVIDLNTFDQDVFNIAIEFTDGLFTCCNYDIYFDDIQVGCLQQGIRETYYTEPCVGFELSTPVIDNKKSWVYNPGTQLISDNVYDNMVRENGTLGMNIEGDGPVIAGGHGSINRVFAPSVDAELAFRDTDYYNYHGVIERHSKLVLNSKQLTLQFNMCPDDDCLINPAFLKHEDGGYIVDDDGGRIVIEKGPPFPNLIELERFKKTFQSFWVQFIEQFIPTTTIFVAGEKWCNNVVCEEKIVNDYLLDAQRSDLSPEPIIQNVVETTNLTEPNKITQNIGVTETFGTLNDSSFYGRMVSTYFNEETGPLTVGDTTLYTLDVLDPDLSSRTIVRQITV